MAPYQQRSSLRSIKLPFWFGSSANIQTLLRGYICLSHQDSASIANILVYILQVPAKFFTTISCDGILFLLRSFILSPCFANLFPFFLRCFLLPFHLLPLLFLPLLPHFHLFHTPFLCHLLITTLLHLLFLNLFPIHLSHQYHHHHHLLFIHHHHHHHHLLLLFHHHHHINLFLWDKYANLEYGKN